jgi:hypothetical protein
MSSDSAIRISVNGFDPWMSLNNISNEIERSIPLGWGNQVGIVSAWLHMLD